jgi:hypothetical protein
VLTCRCAGPLCPCPSARRLDVNCDFTVNLLDGFSKGQYDLVLFKREPQGPGGGTGVWRELLVWAASPRLVLSPGDAAAPRPRASAGRLPQACLGLPRCDEPALANRLHESKSGWAPSCCEGRPWRNRAPEGDGAPRLCAPWS